MSNYGEDDQENPEGLTDKDLAEMLDLMEELDRTMKFEKLLDYKPYKKQKEFHEAGRNMFERLLSAGNQQGKTYSGAMEMAYHLTGRYPKWWHGRKWGRPIRAWAAGEGSMVVRDTIQKLLLGEPTVKEALGTGAIPKEYIIKTIPSRGTADAYDTVQIRHKSGGVSILKFKSYEQERSKFQGETLDLIWLDEEPSMDIYTECLARLTATEGMMYVTFTPLKGMSKVAQRFWQDPGPTRIKIQMTLEDAKHISPEQRQKMVDSYPDYQQEARLNGVPMMGEGLIFKVRESVIKWTPVAIPVHWACIAAMDIGIAHPTAAVWIAWDRDTDICYIYDAYRQSGGSVPVHASAINGRGKDIPMVWPKDADHRDKGSGKTVAAQYRAAGVNMLSVHAQFPDKSVSVEAGIMDMNERMLTGRLRVASHLEEWFEEFRSYHRKDGQIVKLQDDLLSATRYGIMMLRYAKTREFGRTKKKQRIASGVNYSIFG